jgi:hypothetical protein
MAILALSGEIGKITGHLGFGYDNNDSFFKNNTFYNDSYPAENGFSGEKMYTSSGNFDNTDTYIVYFNRNCVGGMSGSGFYHSNRNVYAVLSHGDYNTPTGNTRITYAKFLNIRDYCLPQTGIYENDKDNSMNFQIYPNPVEDIINVRLDNSLNPKTIKIIDLYGRTILSSYAEIGCDLVIIPINNIKTGFYIIIVNNGKSVITQSFVKI